MAKKFQYQRYAREEFERYEGGLSPSNFSPDSSTDFHSQFHNSLGTNSENDDSSTSSSGGTKSSYKRASDRPPASVARRNARERKRVMTVNQAFLLLKFHIPELKMRSKRVSKLKILQGAINYMCDLLDVLDNLEPLAPLPPELTAPAKYPVELEPQCYSIPEPSYSSQYIPNHDHQTAGFHNHSHPGMMMTDPYTGDFLGNHHHQGLPTVPYPQNEAHHQQQFFEPVHGYPDVPHLHHQYIQMG